MNHVLQGQVNWWIDVGEPRLTGLVLEILETVGFLRLLNSRKWYGMRTRQNGPSCIPSVRSPPVIYLLWSELCSASESVISTTHEALRLEAHSYTRSNHKNLSEKRSWEKANGLERSRLAPSVSGTSPHHLIVRALKRSAVSLRGRWTPWPPTTRLGCSQWRTGLARIGSQEMTVTFPGIFLVGC